MKLFQFLVAALLLISSAIVLAEKPDPVDNPPLQVREANVDTLGYIAVHEQGTVNSAWGTRVKKFSSKRTGR